MHTQERKRRLIIANTYYQMIVAIQLADTIFKQDEVVLLLSDHSRNTEKISERLNAEQVFAKTYYIKTKNIFLHRTFFAKLKDLLEISFSKKNRYGTYLKELENLDFDELICYNFAIDIYGLYSILYGKNKDIKVSFFEEGILSYGFKAEIGHKRLIKFLRHSAGKKDITEAYRSFYCFYPSFYYGDLQTVQIPNIARKSKCSETLKKIFDIDEGKLYYPAKNIFFASVCDFEGGEPIGEYDLVCKIAKKVGKENLIIKIHPRDTRTIYEDAGFRVDRNSAIPWEAIQLSADFQEKVFITATSGSVLAGSLMSENKVKTYYMYKCCNLEGNPLAKYGAGNVEKLLHHPAMRSTFKMVKVVESVADILE